MRIALIPSAYAPAVGGVEELTHRLASRLQSQGDVVEVWANRHPAELAAAESIAGVAVRRFDFAWPKRDPSALARFPLQMGTSVAQLVRATRRVRPDVLHVQCFSSNGAYATLLSKLTGVPLVISLQGETVMDDSDIYDHSREMRAALRRGLRQASAVTGCSQFVLDDAARFGLANGRVVPNAVELDEGVVPAPLALPFEEFIFAVGRMVPKKGFDLLLAAFAEVAAERPEVGLVLGGQGSARDALLAQASAAGLADRVVLPGVLSRGQVAWAMGSCAVFVLPSRVEPFGIVVLEAARARAAIVATTRGGAGDVVRDDREALLADPFDTDALAERLRTLLGDPALRRRLGAAARERAGEFTWKRVTADYRALYDEVTGD